MIIPFICLKSGLSFNSGFTSQFGLTGNQVRSSVIWHLKFQSIMHSFHVKWLIPCLDKWLTFKKESINSSPIALVHRLNSVICLVWKTFLNPQNHTICNNFCVFISACKISNKPLNMITLLFSMTVSLI